MPATLNAVLFDLDGTLIDRDRAFRELVWAEFSPAPVRAELLRLDEHGHGDRQALFAAWHRHGGTALDQCRLGCLLAERIEPDLALIQALQELAARVKLGVITNGGAESQRRKIRAARLDAVFQPDRVWVSAEVGMAKPEPLLFKLACQTLHEAPANCLFVGDHERNDVAGAKSAGLRAHLTDAVLDAERLATLLAREGLA